MTISLPVQPGIPATPRDHALFDAAKELETSFLSEMLKASGLGKPSGSFGGGIGEEQFASFLVDQHARALVDRGGIGLAESLFNSLKEREND